MLLLNTRVTVHVSTEYKTRHFSTGFSGEATEWLLRNREIAGLGTECVDVELGWKTNNQVDKYCAFYLLIPILYMYDRKFKSRTTQYCEDKRTKAS